MIIKPSFIVDGEETKPITLASERETVINVTGFKSSYIDKKKEFHDALRKVFPGIQTMKESDILFDSVLLEKSCFVAKSLERITYYKRGELKFGQLYIRQYVEETGFAVTYDLSGIYSQTNKNKFISTHSVRRYGKIITTVYSNLLINMDITYYKTQRNGRPHFIGFPKLK